MAFRSNESFQVPIHLGGQDFTFLLNTRPLQLGDHATIQYYWFDSRTFRRLRKQGAADNFRNCVGHWAAAMQSSGLSQDLDQQIHYVTAVCYALVSNCKSLQATFKDAFLAPKALKDTQPVSATVQQRVQEIVTSRNRFRVQQEFDQVLGKFEPPTRLLPLLQEAFRSWVGNGVVQMRQHGNDGLETFLGEVESWLKKYRKKSNQWVRHFINLFAYECKVSFYRCYANTWVDLIPWLKQHRALDEISERFLRFWHNQNQPIEIPHGRTIGGLYYPTHGRATVIKGNRRGRRTRESVTWENPHLGPTHVKDVLSGQVLSLHPLSAFFMQDPESCAVAGKFFASDSYTQVMGKGQVKFCPDYWDLVGAILMNAYRYRQALDLQPHQRRTRGGQARETEETAKEGNELSEKGMLEDFAAYRNLRCPTPQCTGNLQFKRLYPGENEDERIAKFNCSKCQGIVQDRFAFADLRQFLSPNSQ